MLPTSALNLSFYYLMYLTGIYPKRVQIPNVPFFKRRLLIHWCANTLNKFRFVQLLVCWFNFIHQSFIFDLCLPPAALEVMSFMMFSSSVCAINMWKCRELFTHVAYLFKSQSSSALVGMKQRCGLLSVQELLEHLATLAVKRQSEKWVEGLCFAATYSQGLPHTACESTGFVGET